MMLRKGAEISGVKLVFASDIDIEVNEKAQYELESRILATEASKGVFQTAVVVNCVGYKKDSAKTDRMAAMGVVPMRWGVRRILLVSPQEAAVLEKGEQLFKSWKLWQCDFDPAMDAYVVGQPNTAERKIREAVAKGLPWDHHFARLAK